MASPSEKPASRKTPRRRVGALAQYRILLAKDLRQEFHTFEMLSSMGIYALLVLIVFGAAIATAASTLDIQQIAGGLFWVLVIFTSLLGLNRSFNAEKEQGCMEGLLLAPLDRGAIFLAKATANLLFLLLVEVIAVPLFWFFFLNTVTLPEGVALVIVPLLLGTIGIAGIGTLLSTITVNTRGKDVMLAVLFIPIIYPLLYACVVATTMIVGGGPVAPDILLITITLAAAYDIIMILVAWVLYGFVISA